MVAVNLSPDIIQQFTDNSGALLNGGKLFVYNAGTTTKATTYTDSTGSVAQTNPIVLNARGEPQNTLGASVGIWLPPGQSYKFVLAPASDTDPPTNPFWTEDNVPGAITPTQQIFTSGSGTYTKPAGVLWIRVRLIGGGGGGSGAGTSPGTGGTGGNTTFGTSLLTGSGGSPPAGGAASGGNVNLTGGAGGYPVPGLTNAPGGSGGNGPFGGAGQGVFSGNAGEAAATNTGSGGGGGGTSTGTSPGVGGGAGGYVEAIINSPSATYSYAVGAGGTAGTAGTGGAAGGAGGSGLIIVEEHYGY
jgi:hypothetical protein